MRIASMILGVLALAMLAGQASAQTADNMLDLAYSTFRDRPGWEHFDAQKLEADARAKLTAAHGEAPDSQMSPLEKALFYVELMEPPLKASRTFLRYGQITTDGEDGPVPVSFIEVDRFNLGTTDEPHVAWRFNFVPQKGMAAWLQDALRQVISPQEAAGSNCLVAGCLEAKVSTEGSFAWKAGTAPAGGWAVPYVSKTESGHAVSAFAAAEMAVALNIARVDGEDYLWRGPEQPEAITDGSPFLFFLEDRGVAADGVNDAIMGMIRLNDHAIAEMWTRRTDDGKSVTWQKAVVGRP